MNSLILDYDKIANSKTREYFREVVSSYNNGNYRSAVVMLYTVSVCDILFKLKDLDELYGDTVAKKILNEYEKKRHEREKQDSKSSWEYELINEAHRRGLIDSISFAELGNVYTYRNMSAHPILDHDYELCSPSQETAVALIIAVFDRVLTQPPLYIGKIIDSMTDDLKARKQILLSDQNLLKSLINDKYLSHLNDKYFVKVFCAFWKFCFIEEDENCSNNRDINIEVLRLLLDQKHDHLRAAMREDSIHFGCSLNEDSLRSLFFFLSEYPSLYSVLRQENRTVLISFLQNNKELSYISWFLYDDLAVFIDSLRSNHNYTPPFSFIEIMASFFKVNGKTEMFNDYLIECYSMSYSFEEAKRRWYNMLSSRINELTRAQLTKLIEVTNDNNQIYESFHAIYANNQIVRRLVQLGLDGLNLDSFHHFDYDKSLLDM